MATAAEVFDVSVRPACGYSAAISPGPPANGTWGLYIGPFPAARRACPSISVPAFCAALESTFQYPHFLARDE
eukprot:8336394-Pyramimonas_sp.AAC.1